MKRNLIGISSLVALALLFTATGSQAQGISKADVPFAFQVGSKQLPAGCYQVISQLTANVIQIRNCDDASESALSQFRREFPRETASKLVFHHVGGQYFLTQVWGADQAMMIPTSKAEKQVLLASATPQRPEEIYIALK
jgi:hypothetical protein